MREGEFSATVNFINIENDFGVQPLVLIAYKVDFALGYQPCYLLVCIELNYPLFGNVVRFHGIYKLIAQLIGVACYTALSPSSYIANSFEYFFGRLRYCNRGGIITFAHGAMIVYLK